MNFECYCWCTNLFTIKINCQMFLITILYQTTLFICMILGIELTYIDTELIHHNFYGYRCLKYKGTKMWNSLPNSFKYIKSTTRFKRLVKNYLLMTVWLTDYMCILCMAHCFLFLLAWFLILCLYDLILCGCRCLFRPSCVFFYIFLIFLKSFFITFLYFFVLTVFFVLFYGGQFNGLLWPFW